MILNTQEFGDLLKELRESDAKNRSAIIAFKLINAVIRVKTREEYFLVVNSVNIEAEGKSIILGCASPDFLVSLQGDEFSFSLRRLAYPADLVELVRWGN